MNETSETGADEIVLEYELDFSDYAAMVRESRPAASRIAREVVIWLLLAFNVAFFVAGVGRDPLARGSGAIAILIVAWRFGNEPWMARRHFAKMEMGGKKGVVRFAEAGIQLSFGSISTDIGWDAVQRISRAPHQLFFWISKLQAVIVPLRVFQESGQEERLVSLAMRKTKKNVE